MFVFYDKNGVLRETINDEALRLGDYNSKRIYFYFDNTTPDNIFVLVEWANLTQTNEISIIDNSVEMEIPYDKERTLKYFKEFKKYKFYYYDIENVLSDGLASATVRLVYGENSINAQGMLLFNVEENKIKKEHYITQSQYDYLISYIGKNKALDDELNIASTNPVMNKAIALALQDINNVLKTVKISEIKLNENTLQLLDENMQEIAAIDLPYVNLTDFEETTKNIPNNIELKLNETNYRLKAELSSQNGVIAQSNEIDLPIESLVVGAQYLDGRIILLLKNGTSIDVELTDLIRGLVNETDFELFQNNINGEIGNLQNGISSLDRYATENINNLQDRVSDLEQNSGGSNITVEQEVNDSTNPVSSKAVKNEFGRFSNAYDEIINSKKTEAINEAKSYTDSSIQQAIIDSWEVSV